MIPPLLNSITETFVQASFYILFGLFLSGLIQAFISKEAVVRHIGGRNFKSVLLAAIGGIPLPLCSCGVIPMAISLHQRGASRSAVISFLIATPETGLDSILLSFALLNPLMAIFRPIAAFITALIAGVMENIFDKSVDKNDEQVPTDCCASPSQDQRSWVARLKEGLFYAFDQLLLDLTPWLLAGLVMAGLISYYVPASFVERFLSPGLPAMLMMLVIGLPLYICASAATPIAAALILKGMSPGTALVLLLAGPASNTATMIAVFKFLGRRALIIYLASIAVCSIGFGLLLDMICQYAAIDVKGAISQHVGHGVSPAIEGLAASLLALLMAQVLYRRYLCD